MSRKEPLSNSASTMTTDSALCPLSEARGSLWLAGISVRISTALGSPVLVPHALIACNAEREARRAASNSELVGRGSCSSSTYMYVCVYMYVYRYSKIDR